MLINDGVISSKIGFTSSAHDLKNLLHNVVNYCINQQVSSIYIGGDGSDISDNLIESVFKAEAQNFTVDLEFFTRPVGFFELKWLCSVQSSKQNNIVGIYISSSFNNSLEYNIQFCNIGKNPYKSLKAFIRPSKLKTFINKENLEDSEFFKIRNIDIQNYDKYLLDNKFINKKLINQASDIFIDVMFGPGEFFTSALQEFNTNIKLLNLYSKTQRIKNYIPDPTGNFLSWTSDYLKPGDVSKSFLFAVNHVGNKFGVYDLKHKIEISFSSILLIIIFYLTQIEKRKGTIALYEGVSESVLELCNKLNLKVKIISSEDSLYTKPKGLGRAGMLLCVPSAGNICHKKDIFEGNILISICKVIECSIKLKKSPKELVEYIKDKATLTDFKNATLYFKESAFKKLNTNLNNILILNKKVSFNNVKIYTKNNRLTTLFELYLEGSQLDLTNFINTYIQKGED